MLDRAHRRVFLELFFNHLEIEADGREWIADLVRKRCRELSRCGLCLSFGQFAERAPQALRHGVEGPGYSGDLVRSGLLDRAFEISAIHRHGGGSQRFQ